MPRLIETDTDEAIELGDLVEMLETQPFDGRDQDCFASWGPQLKKLANNRRFLGDIVVAELKGRCHEQLTRNQYSPQVIVLHTSGNRFLLRANFWPALNDSVVRQTGTAPFFYGLAHDHNFSFLTVGYVGSGYWSDYYEYDYDQVVGFAGEKVDLRFVERSRLEQGKVMLYRAHLDVHKQLPADDMSVSINIMEGNHAAPFRNQYGFDVDEGLITGPVEALPIQQLIMMAAHFAGDEGRDLVTEFADHHPSDPIRLQAVRAGASTLPNVDARIEYFARATAGDNRYISEMAKQEIAKLEMSRAWIERSPIPHA